MKITSVKKKGPQNDLRSECEFIGFKFCYEMFTTFKWNSAEGLLVLLLHFDSSSHSVFVVCLSFHFGLAMSSFPCVWCCCGLRSSVFGVVLQVHCVLACSRCCFVFCFGMLLSFAAFPFCSRVSFFLLWRKWWWMGQSSITTMAQ